MYETGILNYLAGKEGYGDTEARVLCSSVFVELRLRDPYSFV